MFGRLKGVAVGCAALAIASTALYAAGNYSTYPIVGSGSFCASTVGVNGQAGITGQGGGAAGTNGAYCAQTVPAGPSIVTGNELIPADTALTGGASPQSVVIPMASLNALPLTVSTALTASPNTLNATNATGGYVFHAASTISSVTVNLPPAPIDGQQFALSADQTITTLVVTPTTVGQTVAKMPTVLTSSTTVSYGYRFVYSVALLQWTRLQ